MNGDFIIHLEDYADAILGLPAESAGKLFLSLVTYAKGEETGHLLDDDLLARSIFSIMKTHIDRDREYKELKSRAGKRGGAPVGNSNASKQYINDLTFEEFVDMVNEYNGVTAEAFQRRGPRRGSASPGRPGNGCPAPWSPSCRTPGRRPAARPGG